MSAGTFFIVNSIDPSRTISLRHRFVADMNRRFFRLLSDIREAVVQLDVFGLSTPQRLAFNASGLHPGQFNFPRNDRKVEEFVGWLAGKNEEYILSGGAAGIRAIGDISGDASKARSSWMKAYLDSAYQTGIRRARQELKKLGVEIDDGSLGGNPIRVAFNSPVHVDRVGLIYTRAYTSLKSITTEMESAISDVLALSLAEGRNPREIARTLDKTITGSGETLSIVDSLGRRIPSRRRAEMLARTEVIRAHHAANMGEYRSANALGIKVLAEHLTAGDGRVCPICAPKNGVKYTLDEAEYIIPVHPQCRCVAIPYIQE